MKGTTITLRVASRYEAELIADVSRTTFYETFAEYNTEEDMELFLKEQFTRRSLVAEVGMPNNTFILAYADNQLAGYVKLREGPAPKELDGLKSLEIARLYSVKNMIGKGIGKALMEESIQLGTLKNKQVIWLAVWERNQRAIDFYTKWGFKVFGQQVFLLGKDLQKDWMMKKEL